MQQSDKVSGYLKSVCDQIRWKKAHGVIAEEIQNHITDQANAFKACGLDEETATDKAIKEMGDPVLVGSEFDRTYRPKVEWSLFVLTGIILLVGFAVRMFINNNMGTALLIDRSIVSTIFGAACMLLAYFCDFTTLGKYPKIIYFGLIALIIGVIFLSPSVYGQKYYAKFMMLLFPTAFTGIIYSIRNKGYPGILLSGVFFTIPCFIGLMIPSISGMISYALACLMLLTYAIVKGWFNVNRLSALFLVYGPSLLLATVIFLAAFLNKPYRMERLQSAINPYPYRSSHGYIESITRDMLSNARFLGQGELGKSAGSILPNSDSDFILTYLIHRLGWVSFIAIMALVITFIMRAFILCSRQKSILGRLVSTSILMTFTLEVFLYVTNNLGFQLFSSLGLPLITYSGTGTIVNMLLIGIMLSVFKSDSLVRDNQSKHVRRKNKLFEIVDGKFIIYLKNMQ